VPVLLPLVSRLSCMALCLPGVRLVRLPLCLCLLTDPSCPSCLQIGWLQVTEAQQQWWNFKADNFDSVLLFKVGKFYEVRRTAAALALPR
jgi:hypothetical protein